MKSWLALSVLLLGISGKVVAQDDLFGTTKKEARKGFTIAVNGNFDVPAMDMADRFGLSYRIGPSVFYKTKSNWIIGAKTDFIFGDQIKQPGFLSNIRHPDGSFIASNGYRVDVALFERGYAAGFMAGKIFNFSEKNADNGLLLLTSAGFIQHKILISTDKSGSVPQLSGEYRKGYDRLTNGWFLEQFVGYIHFSQSGLINFNIGLNVLAGFTAGRRDFLYDVQKPGNESRVDMLIGLRGSWFVPIFKRKSEEYFFE